MGFFDIFKTGESSRSSRRSPEKKRGSSSRKRTVRSSSKKHSWLGNSTQPRSSDTSTSAPSKTLTKAERSAINKKAWAAKNSKEKAANAATKPTKQPAKTSTASPSRTRSERIKPTIAGSSPTEKMTRAERSVINKELHRNQRELEMKAAATKQGSKRRSDIFKTQGEHKTYIMSEKWKKK